MWKRIKNAFKVFFCFVCSTQERQKRTHIIWPSWKRSTGGYLIKLLSKIVLNTTLNKYQSFISGLFNAGGFFPYEVACGFGAFSICFFKKEKKQTKKECIRDWVGQNFWQVLSKPNSNLITNQSWVYKPDSKPEHLGNFMSRSLVYPTVCPTGRINLPHLNATNQN